MSRFPGAWTAPLGLSLFLAAPARAADTSAVGPLTVANLQGIAAACEEDDAVGGCRASLCTDQPVDFCTLRDDEQARLALAADPTVTRWMATRALRMQKVEKPAAPPPGATPDFRDGMEPVSGGNKFFEGFSGNPTRTVEQQVALVVAGLGRLIEDRARQEAMGWALDTLGRDLCDYDDGLPGSRGFPSLLAGIRDETAKARVRTELRENYLRSFCGLASSPRLTGYGAGKATLQIVRDAVEDDAKDLPGAVAGAGIATAFGAIRAENPYGADAWEVIRAHAAATDAAGHYLRAQAAADAALAWWKEATDAAPKPVSFDQAALTELRDVAAREGIGAAATAARAEAKANGSAWDTLRAARLKDAVATERTIDLVARLYAAATALEAEGARDKGPDAVKATGASTSRVAAALKAWAANAQAVKASAKPGTDPEECALPIDTLPSRWPGLEAAQTAGKAACGGDPDAVKAYQERLAVLAGEVAGSYRAPSRQAGELLRAATDLRKAVKAPERKLATQKIVDAATALVAEAAALEAALDAREVAGHELQAAAVSIASDVAPGLPEPDLRAAVRLAFRRVVDGGDPLYALGELGRALDTGNRRSLTGERLVVYSPEVQVFACAVAFPAAHQGVLAATGTTEVSNATIAAALVNAAPCWEIFGEGHRMAYRAKDPWGATGLAVDEPALPERIERLTTARRLYEQLSLPGSTLAASWRHMVATQKAVSEQLDVFAEDNSATLAGLRESGLTGAEVDQLKSALEGQLESGRRLLLLQLGVLDDALDLASGITGTVRGGQKQLRGLCTNRSDATCTLPIDLSPLAKVDGAVAELRAGVTLVKQVVSGKPAEALASGLSELPKLCGGVLGHEDRQQCERTTAELATVAGGLGALVEAETADDAAKALNGVVNPPGGWKLKQVPGTLSVSLTAHPGFMGGAEWRYGPNGLVLENGGPVADSVYLAAPTVALPLGLEASFRKRFLFFFDSAFVPLLDPAAFLQYDVSAGGDLPDPNLLTVLSPGLGLRASVPHTPFGFLFAGIYRPNLRSASGAAFESHGANAIQAVASLTVDVTLLNLYRSNDRPEKK